MAIGCLVGGLEPVGVAPADGYLVLHFFSHDLSPLHCFKHSGEDVMFVRSAGLGNGLDPGDVGSDGGCLLLHLSSHVLSPLHSRKHSGKVVRLLRMGGLVGELCG